MIKVQCGEKWDRDRADIWQVNIKCNAINVIVCCPNPSFWTEDSFSQLVGVLAVVASHLSLFLRITLG